MSDQPSHVNTLIGCDVVLDTAGPVTYLGRLSAIERDGYVLEDADIRDRHEGHVSKEKYICDARSEGIQPNRARIFVFADAVISMSALEDVIGD